MATDNFSTNQEFLCGIVRDAVETQVCLDAAFLSAARDWLTSYGPEADMLARVIAPARLQLREFAITTAVSITQSASLGFALQIAPLNLFFQMTQERSQEYGSQITVEVAAVPTAEEKS
jgi:hypothetical protein